MITAFLRTEISGSADSAAPRRVLNGISIGILPFTSGVLNLRSRQRKPKARFFCSYDNGAHPCWLQMVSTALH